MSRKILNEFQQTTIAKYVPADTREFLSTEIPSDMMKNCEQYSSVKDD